MPQYDAEGYARLLQALLPTGSVWPRDPEATLTGLLTAWADELARVDGRGDDLVEEADPRTTFEMLTDFERVCGLPDECTQMGATLAERREAVLAKLTHAGGQSSAYFIGLAKAIGYEIAITEFHAFTTESTCDDHVYNDSWAFVWQVTAPETTIRYFDTESVVSEHLATWGNERLECFIDKAKPAHTLVLHAYET